MPNTLLENNLVLDTIHKANERFKKIGLHLNPHTRTVTDNAVLYQVNHGPIHVAYYELVQTDEQLVADFLYRLRDFKGRHKHPLTFYSNYGLEILVYNQF